jgi:hypothetical protein
MVYTPAWASAKVCTTVCGRAWAPDGKPGRARAYATEGWACDAGRESLRRRLVSMSYRAAVWGTVSSMHPPRKWARVLLPGRLALCV